MEDQRKKDIYAVCVEFDVIICEDDPYCRYISNHDSEND